LLPGVASQRLPVVGLVLVSHSGVLAEGLREMIEQVARGTVRLAVAGGTKDGRLAPDPLRVRDAIKEVLGDGGVLVMVDFGSSVLAAEMAIEMLTMHERSLVAISGGPFVEGAMMAAVQIGIGANLVEATAAADTAGQLPKLFESDEADGQPLWARGGRSDLSSSPPVTDAEPSPGQSSIPDPKP
jgi:phosphoenolpyruvate---glycerone phosphotransferase subunit DhaM